MQEAALSSGQGGGEGGEALGRRWQSRVRGRVGRGAGRIDEGSAFCRQSIAVLGCFKTMKEKVSLPSEGTDSRGPKGLEDSCHMN